MSSYIYCTLGNAPQAFHRIVSLAEELATLLSLDIVCQNGVNTYQNIPMKSQVGIVSEDEHLNHLNNAHLVISHCGAGTLRKITSLKIRSICLPRLSQFGEHVNDHQLEIAFRFSELGLIYLVGDLYSSHIRAKFEFDGYQSFNWKLESVKQELTLNQEIKNYLDSILNH